MVQEQVELNGTLGPSELRPVEKRKRQVNHARIQAHELVLDPELLARSPPDHGRLALRQQLLEHRLVERPRSVRVGVGERRPLRGIGKAQVFELALAARQTPADLAEAVGAAELAEEHGDELTPARKPLGGVIGTMLFDCLLELKAGEEREQLSEDARKTLHGRASLGDCVLVKTNLTQVCTGRALLIPTASRRPNRQFSEKLFWTRVIFYAPRPELLDDLTRQKLLHLRRRHLVQQIF